MVASRTSLPIVAVALGLLLALTAAGSVSAQSTLSGREELDFDRPESWAMKYFASLSLMTGMGVPRRLAAGEVDLGLEAGWIPSLSEAERTVGFGGTKTEDLNKTSVFGRVRTLVGLPRAFSLEVGWVPPLEVGGVESNLLSLAIGRPVFESGGKRLALRPVSYTI